MNICINKLFILLTSSLQTTNIRGPGQFMTPFDHSPFADSADYVPNKCVGWCWKGVASSYTVSGPAHALSLLIDDDNGDFPATWNTPFLLAYSVSCDRRLRRCQTAEVFLKRMIST
ncbi:hypothetical protein QTP88_010898 [Uroleucon formosanum]